MSQFVQAFVVGEHDFPDDSASEAKNGQVWVYDVSGFRCMYANERAFLEEYEWV